MKELETREKALRAEFEAGYPPGKEVPEDFAVMWGPTSQLSCANIDEVDATVTKKDLDTKKARAYQGLHGKLPAGVTESPGWQLKVRKAS